VTPLQQSESDAIALLAKQIEPEEKTFVDILVQDPEFNISAAAKAAGYEGDKAGDRLLKKQAVVRYLAAIQADRRERHRDIRDQCIQALWQLASGWDMAAVSNSKGEAIPPNELPASLRAAIKAAKIGKFGWEYMFVDRAQILTILLRHFGEVEGRYLGDVPVERPRRVLYDDY
jgi:Terminase small subunit